MKSTTAVAGTAKGDGAATDSPSSIPGPVGPLGKFALLVGALVPPALSTSCYVLPQPKESMAQIGWLCGDFRLERGRGLITHPQIEVRAAPGDSLEFLVWLEPPGGDAKPQAPEIVQQFSLPILHTPLRTEFPVLPGTEQAFAGVRVRESGEIIAK